MSVSDHDALSLQVPRVTRPKTVKEQVYQTIREQLMHGYGSPNTRIVEKDLTEQLGVSRTPVREALARLAHEGFLIATRYGYKIPPFGREELDNLFEVRLLLEPTAARRAAEAAGDVGLQQMREAIENEKRAHETGELNRFLKAHLRFRDAWLSRVRNPFLLNTLANMLHSLKFIRRRTMSDPVIQSFIIKTQCELLEAIAAGNPERAERVQRNTVSNFHQLVLARLFSGSDTRAS